MSTEPKNNIGHNDEHFEKEDEKNILNEIDKSDANTVENRFHTALSNAETKIEHFFNETLSTTLSDNTKQQIEEARSRMKDEFSKIKKWFNDRIAEIKAKPDDSKNKMSVFKEEFLVQWADFKKIIFKQTQRVRNLLPGAKKVGLNTEEIITKAKNAINEIILPKLKDLYAVSKAAVEGAIKGVKEMNKNKDESEKK
jgi:hypothetical protein